MESKPDLLIPFNTYIREFSRFDRSLSSLHPYRKLRSISQSLGEERKSTCLKLLSMFRFRQLKVDGGTQLVPELSDESDPGNECLTGMMVLLIISFSRVLDIWLPFPLVFGTLASSPCLHSPESVHRTGVSALYPRILHAYKRVILPVTGDTTLSSHALLMEDLRYLYSIFDGCPVFPVMDSLQLLNQIVSSANLGQEIRMNQIHRGFPSSPSLSASYSPSYRRSVIEQSVTEGGEWTLLDQL